MTRIRCAAAALLLLAASCTSPVEVSPPAPATPVHPVLSARGGAFLDTAVGDTTQVTAEKGGQGMGSGN